MGDHFRPGAIDIGASYTLTFGDDERRRYEDMIARHARPVEPDVFEMVFERPGTVRTRPRLLWLLRRARTRPLLHRHGLAAVVAPMTISITVPEVVY